MTILACPFIPTPNDGVETETSEEQAKTEQSIAQIVTLYRPLRTPTGDILPAEYGLDSITLLRNNHVEFLNNLLSPLSSAFTALDASRPWLLYWVTHSLALLNSQVDLHERWRSVDTIFRCSPTDPPSAFGGGPGQMPHLATTYAAVMALATIGAPDDWRKIDRKAVLDWLLSLKQSDGSFVMHQGGEVDVRGVYCALTVAYLLGIATPALVRDTGKFLAACQTYEGGFASAAFVSDNTSTPLGEAHGGYAFCALASYILLQTSGLLNVTSSSSSSSSSSSKSTEIDVFKLFRWASLMQALPIEGGGFRGRTNKLVDGCYSWWNGGLFHLIDAILPRNPNSRVRDTADPYSPDFDDEDDEEEELHSVLFDRDALQEYILLVAQNPSGGLRDKPGKNPDAYHTCYNLSGLSIVQHKFRFHYERVKRLLEMAQAPKSVSSIEVIKDQDETDEQAQRRLDRSYAALMAWDSDSRFQHVLGKQANCVERTHPLLNITMDALADMTAFFYGKDVWEEED